MYIEEDGKWRTVYYPGIFKGDQSRMIADWEILKLFFHHHGIAPTWQYNSQWGNHHIVTSCDGVKLEKDCLGDKVETGLWTGVLGQVTEMNHHHTMMMSCFRLSVGRQMWPCPRLPAPTS